MCVVLCVAKREYDVFFRYDTGHAKELSVKDSCQLESIRAKERVLTLRKEMSPDRREEGKIS